MKTRFALLCVVLSLGACASAETPVDVGSVESPKPTATKEPLRLWVSAKDASHSFEGFIEPSGTGMSIRYELDIEGAAEYMILGYPGDDGLIAQSAELRGERLRTGYLSMGDPDPNMPMWRRPRGVKLTVYFKDGQQLSAAATREIRPVGTAARAKRFPIADKSGHVSVRCPASDVGGGGTGWGPVRRGSPTAEGALRNHFRKHRYTWPALPDQKYFRRAKSGSRWAPFVYRESGRNLAVVRVFRSENGWGVKYVSVCDSAMP
jgi:hypothetical protein